MAEAKLNWPPIDTMSKTKKAAKTPPASIVWFDIAADNMERASKFYGKLFGWEIKPMPEMADYWHINTGGGDQTPDGALMKRMHTSHAITQYVLVPSVSRYLTKVEKLGGKICKPKTAVPKMGYLAICQDTENNTFAIWEPNAKAK
jgi:predicted enzyme related to lactoylglutathione lyase